MALKKFKGTSPGVRGKVMVDRSHLYKRGPYRPLTHVLKKHGGRNAGGKLTNRRIGGGTRKRYRMIDFKWEFKTAMVERLEYDPNRSAFIALVLDDQDKYRYLLAGNDWKPGDKVSREIYEPNCKVMLSQLKEGDIGFGLSADKYGKAQIARSAGSFVRVITKDEGRVTLKMPSGELKWFKDDAWLTLGRCSKIEHFKENWSKAGTAVNKGRRPIVRGIAQDTPYHPMGGKGQNKGGVPKSRYGKLAKGPRTRSKKKLSSKFILKRRYDA